jgi:predicted nucleotidyltransferase
MLCGLKQNTIDKVTSVFAKYPLIERVVLYGSRAKGNYQNGSDIDLTIISDNISQKDLHKIENEIDDLLLPYTFDISIFSNIKNDSLIDHIKQVGLDFYMKTKPEQP